MNATQLEIMFDYASHDESELMWIPVAKCQPHPLNPRMGYNEKQVERISEQIKQHGYKPEHAITVRPINEHYEIVSGHHRVEACKRINQEKILAWVKGNMSDEEAHSLLLLDNDQSELTPLEKGRHAFDHIEQFDHKGGRGKTGGIREYARVHGFNNHAVVLQWLDAYRVILETGKLFTSLSPTILYEISKSSEFAWQPLCQHALDEEWTVAQAKDFVNRINTIEKSIPNWWNVDFLSVVELAISNKTKAKSLKAMFTEAAAITDSLKTVTIYQHEKHIREYKGKEYQFKNPSNIWRFPCVDDKHPDRTEHPTQKPVELIERIIKANCPLDGLVLDPFLGSGTTGVAAMKNRRLSIGIDNNRQYLNIARSRFEDVEIGGAEIEI